MDVMSRQVVSVVALALVASAVLGLYLGYSRANAAPGGGQDEASAGAPTVGVAAKTASPIPDSAPPPPVPDEAFIRKIAREEAQAALHPHHAAPAPDNSDDSGDDDDSDDGSHAPLPDSAQTPPPPAPTQ